MVWPNKTVIQRLPPVLYIQYFIRYSPELDVIKWRRNKISNSLSKPSISTVSSVLDLAEIDLRNGILTNIHTYNSRHSGIEYTDYADYTLTKGKTIEDDRPCQLLIHDQKNVASCDTIGSGQKDWILDLSATHWAGLVGTRHTCTVAWCWYS